MTRGQYLAMRGMPDGMPVMDAGAYLVAALMDAGPTCYDAMGERPLDWPDLWAFGQATGAVSEPWEYRALRGMSRGYMAARNAAVEPLAIAPVEQASG